MPKLDRVAAGAEWMNQRAITGFSFGLKAHSRQV